jgi:hypothetical protein
MDSLLIVNKEAIFEWACEQKDEERNLLRTFREMMMAVTKYIKATAWMGSNTLYNFFPNM